MRKNLLFGLLILFVPFFSLFECSKRIPKQKEKKGFKEINKIKKSHNTRNTSKNLRRAEEGRFNTSFVPLNIFLDLLILIIHFLMKLLGKKQSIISSKQ